MKTRIPKLLVCTVLFGAVTLAQAQFDYTNNGDGTCTITSYTGSGGPVVIPDTINDLTVTSIGNSAFYKAISVTSVTITNSVTTIGTNAFEYCGGLTNVTIGNNVTNMGDYAFYYCTNLTGVAIGNGVASIAQMTFYYCSSLKSVTIPNSVTNIGNDAFAFCTSLVGVTIPNSVISIGDNAFIQCSLTNFTIPRSTINIGRVPFINCHGLTAISVDTNNPAYSSVNGVLFDKNQTTLIEYPAGVAAFYAIPNSVTNIGDAAFALCTHLEGVTIPNSVTSIGFEAFGGCGRLTNIVIPNSVTSITNMTFYGCSLMSVTIPASITSIGGSAFEQCTILTSVTIPNSVTNIGSGAFRDCYSLTSAYFQGNAPNDTGAFYGDTNIVYYLPGTTGWGPTFGGRPTELWNPQAKAFSVTAGHFGFNITGPSNTVIVVEACANLGNPVWLPVSTNALDGSGASSFSDSQSGDYPARFYRFRSP